MATNAVLARRMVSPRKASEANTERETEGTTMTFTREHRQAAMDSLRHDAEMGVMYIQPRTYEFYDMLAESEAELASSIENVAMWRELDALARTKVTELKTEMADLDSLLSASQRAFRAALERKGDHIQDLQATVDRQDLLIERLNGRNVF